MYLGRVQEHASECSLVLVCEYVLIWAILYVGFEGIPKPKSLSRDVQSVSSVFFSLPLSLNHPGPSAETDLTFTYMPPLAASK